MDWIGLGWLALCVVLALALGLFIAWLDNYPEEEKEC